MKIRKEYVIFGGVVIAFVGLFVISSLLGGRSMYNGDKVTINFGEDTPVFGTVEGDVIEEAGGEFEGTVLGDLDDTVPETALDSVVGENSPAAVVVNGLDIAEPTDDFVESVEGGEVVDGEEPIDGEQLEEPQYTGPETRLSPNEYADLVMHYVCGTRDSHFDSYLSLWLQNTYGNTDVWPYSSLQGNTSFTNVKIDEADSVFSFTAGDGETYSFRVLFDGNLISEIDPLE